MSKKTIDVVFTVECECDSDCKNCKYSLIPSECEPWYDGVVSTLKFQKATGHGAFDVLKKIDAQYGVEKIDEDSEEDVVDNVLNEVNEPKNRLVLLKEKLDNLGWNEVAGDLDLIIEEIGLWQQRWKNK